MDQNYTSLHCTELQSHCSDHPKEFPVTLEYLDISEVFYTFVRYSSVCAIFRVRKRIFYVRVGVRAAKTDRVIINIGGDLF